MYVWNNSLFSTGTYFGSIVDVQYSLFYSWNNIFIIFWLKLQNTEDLGTTNISLAGTDQPFILGNSRNREQYWSFFSRVHELFFRTFSHLINGKAISLIRCENVLKNISWTVLKKDQYCSLFLLFPKMKASLVPAEDMYEIKLERLRFCSNYSVNP